MRVLPVTLSLAGAFIFVNILGCGGTARCRPVPPIKVAPPARVAECPPPPPAKPVEPRPAECPPPPPAPSCEVRGDLVYNLGGGVIANSSSVTMSGSSRPARYRKYEPACEPCPPAARPATPVPALPAAAPVSAPYDCAAEQCGESPYTALVCESSGFMSACFTLSEEELKAGPELYIPGVVASETLGAAKQVEAEPVAEQAKKNAEDIMSIRPPAAAAVEPEAAPEPSAAPAPAQPEAEVVEAKEAAAALAPLPVVDPYGNVKSIDAALSSMPKLKTEQAKALAEMPSEGEANAVVETPAKLEPPVPAVAEMTEERTMAAKAESTEQLPMVELPPKLD